jgi:hypothetical protein
MTEGTDGLQVTPEVDGARWRQYYRRTGEQLLMDPKSDKLTKCQLTFQCRKQFPFPQGRNIRAKIPVRSKAVLLPLLPNSVSLMLETKPFQVALFMYKYVKLLFHAGSCQRYCIQNLIYACPRSILCLKYRNFKGFLFHNTHEVGDRCFKLPLIC